MIKIYACRLPLEKVKNQKIDWRIIEKIGINTDRYRKKLLVDQYRSYNAYLLLDNVLNSMGEFTEGYIRTNKFGRPHLKNWNTANINIDFNISHSGHWIVLAVGDKKVGIDIEEIVPISLDDLIPFIFEDEKIKQLNRDIQDPKEQLKDFYSEWVKKESHLKMMGTGLFGLQKGESGIWVNNEEIYQKEYDIEEEYKMAISSVTNDLPSTIIYKEYYEISSK